MNARQLTVWSALMAAAHGAGLMVAPFVLNGPARRATEGPHTGHLAAMTSAAGAEAAVLATVIHTVGYLATAWLLAFLVYEYLGVAMTSDCA